MDYEQYSAIALFVSSSTIGSFALGYALSRTVSYFDSRRKNIVNSDSKKEDDERNVSLGLEDII